MDENLINNELLKYIKENVFKVYDLNGKSHDINHIKYVLQRAILFNSHGKRLIRQPLGLQFLYRHIHPISNRR